ncbi:MAG TPA: metallophosphoesterase family protein [Blastocatellia bacterium]|nr:metallophosphoesterase family protein [Blastocatellia bacterium]
MKTILHFSDIHFGGAQAPNWAEAILAEIKTIEPTVVAISGDLTQRARTSQFREARSFLDRISAPIVVVPGNHDVPLWNVFDRFLSPLEKYRRWITADLNPTYVDDDLFVMGLDTTRSFTIKGGRISSGDVEVVRARMCEVSNRLKVLVAHHPLVQPPGFEHEDTVGGVERALRAFADCGIDVVLTGHLHQSHVSVHAEAERGLLLVQAGTAASLRGRGSERLKNSFNLIEVAELEIRVTSYIYSDECARFLASTSTVWPRHKG